MVAPQVLIKRTSTPDSPPALIPGELGVEMSLPFRVWVGVPTALDPTGRKLINSGGVIVAENPPILPANGTLWYESDTGIVWMWYVDPTSSQWIQVNGTGSGFGQAEADTLYVKLTGDTMTGPLSMYPTAPGGSVAINLMASSLGNNDINGYSASGQIRWLARFGNAETDTGANVGSNFEIVAFDDPGTAVLSYPLRINRASGLGTVAGDPVAPLGIATKQYVDAKPAGGISQADADLRYVNIAGDTMTGALVCNSSGQFNTLTTVANTVLGGPVQINTTLYGIGTATFASSLNVGTTINAGGNVTAPAHVCTANGLAYMMATAIDTSFQFSGGCFFVMQYATANTYLYLAGTQCMSFNANGTITINNNGAYKPVGGPWLSVSDARIKTVLGDYQTGLASIKALRPVRYIYKGNDVIDEFIPEAKEGFDPPQPATRAGDPDPRSMNYSLALEGRECIGFVAQEVEGVMPEMVSQRAATIDGIAVTDLRSMDTNALIYALVNAVKELSAEIDLLKGAA